MDAIIQQEIVEAILTARDFCGNEAAAVKQVIDDYGIKPERDYIIKAYEVANERWQDSRMEAIK